LLDVLIGTSLDGTVMNAEVEVLAATEASHVVGAASQRLGFAQHALVACLRALRNTQVCSDSGREERGRDSGDLHVE
jgi:hypothetical protein